MSDSGFTASRAKVGTVYCVVCQTIVCVFYGSPKFNLNSCFIRAVGEPLALMGKKKKKPPTAAMFSVIALTLFHSVMTVIQFSIMGKDFYFFFYQRYN